MIAVDADVRAVRRNLFMSEGKLERRQSVAVMENLRSPKGRHRQRSALCSPRQSPKGKQIQSDTLIIGYLVINVKWCL